MFIDMHSHSTVSDDARATPEAYMKWIQVLRKKGYRVDGIVLTEHRTFDIKSDYADLSLEAGVKIFKGSELDTIYGHILLYGSNIKLMELFDFSKVDLDTEELLIVARKKGGIVIPAHPGRFGVGLVAHFEKGATINGLEIIETYNSSNRSGEQKRAEGLAEKMDLNSIGGSDAHFPSSIGTTLTEFFDPIDSMNDLVEALIAGRCRPVSLEDTRW
jgi:predicted metal-dependent phosphoesterase TrpH